MGGLGSGRWKDRERKTLESYLMLDVDQLSKTGCLRPGSSSTCQWIDGNEVASINLRAEAKRLCLSYPLRVGDREWRDVTDTIAIVHLPCRSTCQWTDGNEVVSINLRAEAERVRLSYAVRAGDGGREDVVDTISVVYLRCRFGGTRAFFICPGPGDGADCGRRITKLHLSQRYFLCRHCNQLAYATDTNNHGSGHSGEPTN